MSVKYDYLIVGAGLFGSVFARQMKDKGRSCLVIDARSHIAGNVYSESIEGIDVHVYGPHIFNTNSDAVWEYVNQFTAFNQYVHRVKVNYRDKLFSFPINLDTLYAVYGVRTPEEAKKKLEEVRLPISHPCNLEEWCLAQIGSELYEVFVKGYTTKQWGTDPKNLPTSIIKRIPVRLTYDDRYHEKKYTGIPSGGYTRLVSNLLDGTQVELGVDFFEMDWSRYAHRVVYTGKIDALFDYCYGELDYRTLRFERRTSVGDYQGIAQMNFTDVDVPYTRITEHKHFNFKNQEKTIITIEYPGKWQKGCEPFYPVNNEKNNALCQKYHKLVGERFIIGGRLGKFAYYDMDQTIANAIVAARQS